VVHQKTTQDDSSECYRTPTRPVKTATGGGTPACYRIHWKDPVYCTKYFWRQRRSF
jgi:hypothetical protein